jgi:hypothetical protein
LEWDQHQHQPFNSVFLSQQISISISRSAVLLQLAEHGEIYVWWSMPPTMLVSSPKSSVYRSLL